jgi:hypothetical protein
VSAPLQIRPRPPYQRCKPVRARQLATEITREIRAKYSVRLPIRGVLEFVAEERIIALIERKLTEAGV